MSVITSRRKAPPQGDNIAAQVSQSAERRSLIAQFQLALHTSDGCADLNSRLSITECIAIPISDTNLESGDSSVEKSPVWQSGTHCTPGVRILNEFENAGQCIAELTILVGRR